MNTSTPRAPRPPRPAAAAAVALVVAAVALAALAPGCATARLRAVAARRGYTLAWTRLAYRAPAGARITGLVVRRTADGDTLVAADELDVRLRLLPLLAGRVAPAWANLEHARIRLAAARDARPDTLAPEPGERDDDAGPAVAPAVRARAEALVRALLAPARTLPELRLADVTVARGGEPRLALATFELRHHADAESLAVAGTLRGETDVPFEARARWQRDDRLAARAVFRLAPRAGDPPGSPDTFTLAIDGRITQDRRAREVRVAEGTTVRVGRLAANVTARVREAGPRFTLAMDAEGLDAERIRASVPAAMLGPLAGLALHGAFDWSAGFDLDLAHPDSVTFRAGVVPRGIALDPAASRPSLAALAGPFVANIHLPHDRIVTRDLSDANPHYRPLAAISPHLRDALVTNEDGGFWRHRGFNTEAIGLAVAANLRAGSYKRGAGTITMQLARNLWLGHRRTLARKGQEVAFAWLLEHEAALSKERLLEIYLNIIEWGPGVHGADEAARYYFDEDAGELSLPEALFLTIVVPSPTKWRWRFAPDGTLKPYAREQMHFIANKMAAKGWLDPALVPPADSLRVSLRGPARTLFGAPDTSAAADSLAGEQP